MNLRHWQEADVDRLRFILADCDCPMTLEEHMLQQLAMEIFPEASEAQLGWVFAGLASALAALVADPELVGAFAGRLRRHTSQDALHARAGARLLAALSDLTAIFPGESEVRR